VLESPRERLTGNGFIRECGLDHLVYDGQMPRRLAIAAIVAFLLPAIQAIGEMNRMALQLRRRSLADVQPPDNYSYTATAGVSAAQIS
jgi:hypothetical protein